MSIFRYGFYLSSFTLHQWVSSSRHSMIHRLWALFHIITVSITPLFESQTHFSAGSVAKDRFDRTSSFKTSLLVRRCRWIDQRRHVNEVKSSSDSYRVIVLPVVHWYIMTPMALLSGTLKIRPEHARSDQSSLHSSFFKLHLLWSPAEGCYSFLARFVDTEHWLELSSWELISVIRLRLDIYIKQRW